MNKVILETDIYSEVVKRKNSNVIAKALSYRAVHSHYTITIFTVTEAVKGFQKIQRQDLILNFLSCLPKLEVLPFNLECAKIAGCIFGDLERTGRPIGRCDPFIASVAIHNNLTLVTGNTKHYAVVKELGYPLKLENWKE